MQMLGTYFKLTSELNKMRITLLHHAIISEATLEIVKKIIETSNEDIEDINAQTDDGVTPLMVAVSRGNKDIVKLLIEKKCNLKLKDSSGNTALYYADDLEILQLLIDAKANVNIQNKEGETPLHALIKYSNDNEESYNLIQKLIEAEADLDLTDKHGRTPLYYAAKDKELAKILLQSGANPQLLPERIGYDFYISTGIFKEGSGNCFEYNPNWNEIHFFQSGSEIILKLPKDKVEQFESMLRNLMGQELCERANRREKAFKHLSGDELSRLFTENNIQNPFSEVEDMINTCKNLKLLLNVSYAKNPVNLFYSSTKHGLMTLENENDQRKKIRLN